MPANMNVVSPPSPSVKSICREHITAVHLQDNPPACLLANSTRLLLSRFLAPHLAVGDEIAFPIPVPDRSTAAGTEVIITKHSSERDRYCYQAPIGYVSYPEKTSVTNFSYLQRFVTQGSAYPRFSFRAGLSAIISSMSQSPLREGVDLLLRYIAYFSERVSGRAARGLQAPRAGTHIQWLPPH